MVSLSENFIENGGGMYTLHSPRNRTPPLPSCVRDPLGPVGQCVAAPREHI